MISKNKLFKWILLSAFIHLSIIFYLNNTGAAENEPVPEKKVKQKRVLIVTLIKGSNPNEDMLDFIAEDDFDQLLEESAFCPLRNPFGDYYENETL